MPNIGTVLREEIARLARREIRAQVQATRKASAQYRRHIAALKRQVATLQRLVAPLIKRSLGQPSAARGAASTSLRFVPKGLRAQRDRLGLSAADYGKLAGVSSQSIYNWETGQARPRAGQLERLVALRSIGKREARARLAQLAPKGSRPRRKRPAR